jgi:hypothetical protein
MEGGMEEGNGERRIPGLIGIPCRQPGCRWFAKRVFPDMEINGILAAGGTPFRAVDLQSHRDWSTGEKGW